MVTINHPLSLAWIDSHCHLDDARFNDDLDMVLSRADAQNIKQFIVPAVNASQWVTQQALKTSHPNIFNAFGIHPWFCHQHRNEHLVQLETLLQQAIAVGECGLDLMPNRPALDLQMFWFEAQLKLAEKHQLPVIIHAVKSTDMVLKTLKSYPNIRGVIHGFSGSLQQAEALTKVGFFLGIGTRLIQSDSKKAQQLLKSIPLEVMLLETDAPDGLGAEQRNEPCHLIQVAEYIAKLRNQDVNTILLTCSQNTRELFKL